MAQPPGFEVHGPPGSPPLVCKLNKAIYGLKQASRAWNLKLGAVLKSLGFIQSKADNCLYVLRTHSFCVLLLAYVDDMLLTGNNSAALETIISQLRQHFSLKDLGSLHQFLGVQFTRSSAGLFLNQRHYILEILAKANMVAANGLASPMISSPSLSKFDGQSSVDATHYRSIVGALQYVCLTRPDISFSVNKVSQYMQEPLDTHWKAVKRILRYLAGTLDFGLSFHASPKLNIAAYSDADWASDRDDRKSTSGTCIFLGGNLISWSAKKQHTVSRSSTEAEFRSLTHVVCDVLWLHSLLDELGIVHRQPSPVWVDNLGAVALSNNPVFHSRIKHAEVDFHFVRDHVSRGRIQVRHLPTHAQVADGFTKPLTGHAFTRFRNMLHIVSRPELGLRGGVG